MGSWGDMLASPEKRFTSQHILNLSTMKQTLKLIVAGKLLFLTLSVSGQMHSTGAAGPQPWVATWGASQQIPEPHNALPMDDLRNASVRQIFHLSIGGTALRIHFSNTFGTEPLHIAAAHIARPLSNSAPTIDPASDSALTFAGDRRCDHSAWC